MLTFSSPLDDLSPLSPLLYLLPLLSTRPLRSHLAHSSLPLPRSPSKQPLEIYVDDEKKLTLHGLQQHFVRLEESAKNRKLNDLLDSLEFNQVGP